MPQSTSRTGRTVSASSPLPSAAGGARNLRDYALLFALACCWSSTYPLAKLALGLLLVMAGVAAMTMPAERQKLR